MTPSSPTSAGSTRADGPRKIGVNEDSPGVWTVNVSGAGRGAYPIIDDADPYGVGSSGPAVPAGSGRPRPLPIPETPSAFHLHAQRNAFHYRDVRQHTHELFDP